MDFFLKCSTSFYNQPIKNDIVFIDKRFISPNYINGFSFSYPASLDNQYSKLAIALSDKFIPGWKTGFKIRG